MWGWMLPALMLAGVLAQSAAATVLPGGGPAKSDCYVTLKTDGTTAATNSKKLECTEGDPACDTDGCGNAQCTINVALCVNQTGFTGCTPPAALTSLTVKKNALTGPALNSSACGAFVPEVLPLVVKKGRERPSRPLTFRVTAKATGTKPPTDKDSYTIRCLPRTAACPTTTTAAPTTSTSTSSTSTTSTSSTSTTSTSTTETTTSTTVTTTTTETTTTVTTTTETTTTIAGSTTTTVEPTTTTVEATTTTIESTTTTVEPTTTTVEATTTTVEPTTTTIETTTTTVETTTSTVEPTTTTVETTTSTTETTTTTIP